MPRALFIGVFLILQILSPATARTLRLRVLDDATGHPLESRVVVKTSDGQYPENFYSGPVGWPSGFYAYGFFIKGIYEMEVPAGPTEFTAARGITYLPQTITVNVAETGVTEAEIRLSQIVDLNALGWYAGDAHAHLIHGEQDRAVSYELGGLVGRGSGLNWITYCEAYPDEGLISYEVMTQSACDQWTDHFRMWIGGERPKSSFGHMVSVGAAPFTMAHRPPLLQDPTHRS